MTFIRSIILLSCALIYFGPLFLHAQEQGKLFISQYLAEDYKGHPQNFAVTIDQDGLLYLGNNSSGVKVYDGKTWQESGTPKITARCFENSDSGTIYVGFTNEFGYLDKDENGQINYHSLLPFLDEEHQDVSTIWQVDELAGKVYYFSNDFLYIWDGQQMEYLPLNREYYRQFEINGNIYFNNRRDQKLYILKEKEIVPLDIKNYPIKKLIIAMLPYDKQRILLVTRYEGLFVYHPTEHTVEPISGNANPLLFKDRINEALPLQNGNLALCSAFSGALIIDREANLIRKIDKSAGLNDLTVWNMYQDQRGTLWMTTNNGLSKIELGSGLKYWDEHLGLPGVPLSIKRINGQLYVTTPLGIFFLENNQFKKVQGLDGFVNNIIQIKSIPQEENKIISGSDRGIFYIKDGRASLLLQENNFLLHQYKQNPNYLISTDFSGSIFIYYYNGKNWVRHYTTSEYSIKGVWFTSMTEDTNGDIWLGTEESGVIRMEHPLDTAQLKYTSFADEENLPKEFGYSMGMLNDRVIIYSQNGFHQWQSEENKFIEYSALSRQFGIEESNPSVYPFEQNENGDIWMSHSGSDETVVIGAIKQSDGTFKMDRSPLLRIPSSSYASIYPESDGSVWIGTPERLYNYDPQKANAHLANYRAIINRININKDSLFFAGQMFNKEQSAIPTFVYANNFIRFSFGATTFIEDGQTLFSYRLKGSDNNWSPWSADDYKEFSNLLEGEYSFELKAKNIYAQESEISKFRFEIAPPWFRTTWAYLAYFILGSLLIYFLVRLYNIQLKRENERLEQTVQDRTQEVNQQRQSLEVNNEHLKNTIQQLKQTQGQLIQSEKMASLGQLTAGIAHEINNPINFIGSSAEALKIDYLEVIQVLDKILALKEKDFTDERIKEIISLRNDLDLAYTIEEMDGLIQGIEEGASRTQEIVKGLRIFSRNTSESFHPANINEGIDSTLLIINHQIADHIEIVKNYGQLPLVNCQISKLNQVFLNLIVNSLQAIEASSPGKIIIHTSLKEDQVIITIKDNGIGMDEEVVKKIFEPFYTTKEVGKGTGLGLSVSYGIIKEHQGNIIVKSSPGKGSEFEISIPVKPEGRDKG